MGSIRRAGVGVTNNPGTWPATIESNPDPPQVSHRVLAAWLPACPGNPLLTTYYGVCSYRYTAATDLVPKSDEASGMVSFTKDLPANNSLAVQYFYTQS